MTILALETTAKAASCAVLREGAPLATTWQCTGLTHSRTLMPMVADMLKNSELTLDDIDAVAVAAGPGSFTGLRIGIATVKGLAWAADKPCIGVSTLEAMAWPLAHLTGTVVCAMDARRQQIYNAVFAAQGGELRRLCPDQAISLEEAAESAAPAGDHAARLDLLAAIDRLDQKDQLIIRLRFFEDLKLEEIAQAAGLNLNTVKSRLYKSLRKLRELTGEECSYE